MQTWQMRQVLAEQYPSQKWRDRVKRMSDNQVLAIYRKLKEQGKVK